MLRLTEDIAALARSDSTHTALARARDFQRRAQFMTDFIEAVNSMGFHTDREAARALGRAIDYARRGQIVLAGGDPGAYRPAIPHGPASRAAPLTP